MVLDAMQALAGVGRQHLPLQLLQQGVSYVLEHACDDQ